MTTLNAIILGQATPQIYRLDSDIVPAQLSFSLDAAGGQLFYLDGMKMKDKAQLMQEFATVLNFPDYFGTNWDALYDCLINLDAWIAPSKHQILWFDHWEQCTSPELIAILQDAMADWLSDGAVIYVLLRTPVSMDYMQELSG